MKSTIISLLAVFSIFGFAQQDTFTIEGGTIPSGGSASFNIFYRDVSGTLIDTGVNNVGAFGISFTVPSGTVASADFQRAGVLTNANVLVEQNQSDPGANLLQWAVIFVSAPFFNLDAPQPGDLIGVMTLTTQAGTGGQTISLTPNVGPNFFVQDELGAVAQIFGDGNLGGTFGDIQIQGGSGPEIESFAVNPTGIAVGGSATLSWSVTGADTVTIDQGIGTVSASGSQTVSPSETTIYTLSATAGSDTVTATATLTVTQNPVEIDFFQASPTTINPGETATLSWATNNADLVEINQGIGIVAANGSVQVSPEVPTTYTLTASNDDSIQTAVANVDVVLPPPVINSFVVDPQVIDEGDSAVLSWDVDNAVTVSIEPDIGVVPASSSQTVSPDESVDYILTAQNSQGQVTAQASLLVRQPSSAVINNFVAQPDTIARGNSSTLSWNVSNAQVVVIDQGIGRVDRQAGTETITPDETTTYVMDATANDGTNTLAAVTVTVLPLEIISFTATPEVVIPGESIVLSWEVEAETAHLDRTEGETVIDMGFRELTDAITLSPTVDTIYTMVAQTVESTVTATVTVTMSREGQLIVDTDTLFLDGTDSAELQLSNALDQDLPWNLAEGPDWITVSPRNGNTSGDGQGLTLTLNRDLMERGLQTGTLRFEATQGNAVEVSVTAGETIIVYPEVRGSADFTTELTAINFEQEPVDFVLEFYLPDGTGGPTLVSGRLEPMESFTFDYIDVTGGIGWAALVIPDRPGLALDGFANVRSSDGEELYSYPASHLTAGQIYVPHLAASELFVTNGSLVNLGRNGDGYQFAQGGNQFDLDQLGAHQQANFDFRELMGGTIPPNSWGALVSDDINTPMAAVETFGRADESLRQTVSVGLDGEAANQIIFPHLAADTNIFWTGVLVINPNDVAVTVEFQIYDAEGQPVQAPDLPATIEAGDKKTFLVDKNVQQLGSGAAWLRVNSDQPIFGYMLFGSYAPDDFFSGFQSLKGGSSRVCFPYLDQSTRAGGFTGIALVNPSDEETTVMFELLDRAGAVKAQRSEAVAGRQKYVALAANLFPDSIEIGDKIVAHGVATLAGFEIFGSGRTTLGGILAIDYD